MRDKRDRAITFVFCCDLHLTSMFSGLLQKRSVKRKVKFGRTFYKHNYCPACHTRFVTFFPFRCCWVKLITASI